MATEKTPTTAIAALRARLDHARDVDGTGAPIVRRKFKTLMAASGFRVLAPTLRSALAAGFAAATLHVQPDVLDPTIGQDDYLAIGLTPIQPEAFLFEKEKHLERFIEVSLGIGTLSRLSLYRHPDGRSGRQFPVGDKYVDLLCREALTTNQWGLVAIEIKRRDAPKGTLTQMCEYLQLLKQQFPGRSLRGVIISSSEEAIDKKVLGEANIPYRVDWYRYKVSFEKVGGSE